MEIEVWNGLLKVLTVYIANERNICVLELIQYVKNDSKPPLSSQPPSSPTIPQLLETHFVLLLFALLNPC